jgi:hypothetical protein
MDKIKNILRKIGCLPLNTEAVGFFLLFGAAIALRLYQLGKYDLWYDEVITFGWSYQNLTSMARWAGESIPEFMARSFAADLHSPLYYLLIYPWTFFFGDSIYALRILSVILNVAAGALMYKFTRLFLSRRISLAATALFLLSPMQVWYAQEARGYALSTLLSLLWAYYYVRALRTRRSFYWLVCTLSGIAAFYTNYIFIFLAAASAVSLLSKQGRAAAGAWVVSTLCITAPAFLMAAVVGRNISSALHCFWWIVPPSPQAPFITLTNVIIGYNNSPQRYLVYGAVVIILALYGMFMLRTDRKTLAMLSAFLLVPIAAAYAVSHFLIPVYLDRALMPVAFPLYIFVALALTQVNPRVLRLPLMVMAAMMLASGLADYYTGTMPTAPKFFSYHRGTRSKRNYTPVIAYIKKNFKDGDIVAATCEEADVLLKRYFPSPPPEEGNFRRYLLFIPRYSKVIIWLLEQRDIVCPFEESDTEVYIVKSKPGATVRVLDKRPEECSRIWLVSSIVDVGWKLKENAVQVRARLGEMFTKIDARKAGGLEVELFECRSGVIPVNKRE